MPRLLPHHPRRVIVVLLTVLTIMITMSAITLRLAPPAAAVSCTSPRHDTNGEGIGLLYSTVHLKVAPYAACGNVALAYKGDTVYYWCQYTNSYGNVWWYVRLSGTATYGWLYSGDLYT